LVLFGTGSESHSAEKLLSIEECLMAVTGHDVNPPENFPGWSGFNADFRRP